jgi:catechol 2,3-dioxygenase-like lactoylglutathione lyase family enzyme
MAAFKFNHVHFKTPDPSKTAKWYVDHMGAKIVSQSEGAGGVTNFRLDMHGVPLNVTGFVEGQNLEQSYGMEHVALETDDLAGMVQKLKAGGSRILEERSIGDGRKVCFFEGPEGVRLEVMEMSR